MNTTLFYELLSMANPYCCKCGLPLYAPTATGLCLGCYVDTINKKLNAKGLNQ